MGSTELEMNHPAAARPPLGWMLGILLIAIPTAVQAADTHPTSDVILWERHGPGPVEILPTGLNRWVITDTNQIVHPGDHVRTGPQTRIILRWSDQSTVRLGPLSELEVLPAHEAGASSGLHLFRGLLSFFHRDKPGRIRFIAGGAHGGIEGTEFVLAVEDPGGLPRAIVSVIDGSVELTSAQVIKTFTKGQEAVIEPGRPPELRTAVLAANNVLQWCLYYPAVLDLRDLPWAAAEEQPLAESLAFYRAGDLLSALAAYGNRVPASDAEHVYHASLLLAVGEIAPAEAELQTLPAGSTGDPLPRLTAALRQLIAAVQRRPSSSPADFRLATEFLAASYYEQSRALGDVTLRQALNLAKAATTNSPGFSFAWARVAELEFSFGRTRAAQQAVQRSLELAPRNAGALSLNGFLFAAQNKTREALVWFNRAIEADSALGNAWLGRALCEIRLTPDFFSFSPIGGERRDQGAPPLTARDKSGTNAPLSVFTPEPTALDDLLVAATLEPQRSLLRSYLGKAWTLDRRTTPLARVELDRAIALDPADPTPWLYRALLNEQENRINEGIRDLQTSQERNNNRQVYRSQLLIEQDRAVRSANLARMYQEVGLQEVSLREAGRAVTLDYLDHSSHLFLAETYNGLRDPNQITLRYETPTLVEYLIGNLLAPVGAGVHSPAISASEYTQMFERKRLGLISETEYSSRGAWVQTAAQYGILGTMDYSLDAFYRSDPGDRVNNDVEQSQFDLRVKQKAGPQGNLFLWVLGYNGTAGDVRPLYDPSPTNVNQTLRTKETQAPLLALGYHHEWNPDSHTLLLGGFVMDSYRVDAERFPTLAIWRPNGVVDNFYDDVTVSQEYQSDFQVFSAELQHLLRTGAGTLVAGSRFQRGQFKTRERMTNPMPVAQLPLSDPPEMFTQTVEEPFTRASGYSYWLWDVLTSLQLVGGIAFDWVSFPKDWRFAPADEGQQTESRLSPKAGLVWTPARHTVLRAAYTRSLGGASLDQSLQIEPTHVAGFNQSFRSLIPESLAGANAGARFDTAGVSLEQRFGMGTFAGMSGEWLESGLTRQHGAFVEDAFVQDYVFASSTPERLEFVERSVGASIDQLVGKTLAFGVRYRLSDASYKSRFTDPAVAPHAPRLHEESLLHTLTLQASYNHPAGFFAQAQAVWYAQDNRADLEHLGGDDFWQLALWAGYRSPRRQFEAAVGILNLGDVDYRLHPLTFAAALPRERTFVARLKLHF